MHRLNVRYLGAVRQGINDQYLKSLILLELICRTCKNTLRFRLRRAGESGIPSESVVVDFYNFLFADEKHCNDDDDENQDPIKWWCVDIKRELQYRYPESLTEKEKKEKFDLRTIPYYDSQWLWDRLDTVRVEFSSFFLKI